ncbi:MAG TPA: hypothetical protein VN848_06255 [Gemmatimonadales bacterium]|nr:hypothetical protein [Gemmatimonadales bacterium]
MRSPLRSLPGDGKLVKSLYFAVAAIGLGCPAVSPDVHGSGVRTMARAQLARELSPDGINNIVAFLESLTGCRNPSPARRSSLHVRSLTRLARLACR